MPHRFCHECGTRFLAADSFPATLLGFIVGEGELFIDMPNGETIRVEYWKLENGEIAFRSRIVARDIIVHTGGRASIAS